MSSIKKLQVTLVSVEHEFKDLTEENAPIYLIQHEKNNQFDKNALQVYIQGEMEPIGYVAASPHTIVKGCVSNAELKPYIPNSEVPLIARFVRKDKVVYKNGEVRTALILECTVLEQEQAS